MIFRRLNQLFVASWALSFLSETSWACSVCYGAADSPILAGMNASILFMMGLTYFLLGGFAFFFFRLRKGTARLEENEQDLES